MTREQAIMTLIVVDENATCDDCLYYNQMEDCPNDEDCIIRQALDMAIKALEQKPKWISVSERLPEKSGYYLTTNRYHEVYSDYWEGSRFDCTDVVIAWMPLPKPYEPQESEVEE